MGGGVKLNDFSMIRGFIVPFILLFLNIYYAIFVG